MEIRGCLSAGVDGEGGRMGGKETKVTPKDWPIGHDVDQSDTQYKLTPQMAYKNIFFSPKNRSKHKYCGKSPQRPDLDIFSLPENESSIHLSPKNLDKAVAKLSILRVQHCTTIPARQESLHQRI